MIGGRQPLRGRKLGDRRVRIERPHSAYFRWSGKGVMTAKAAASTPTTGLGLASVDTVTSRQGPIIVEITTNLSIAQFERICGATLADAIIVLLEKEARAKAIRIAAAQQ